ncbi:MAG: alanine/ornithine racemase family PLP-dependent enzyme [Cryomorphaceae bacterium]|nr:alanine/ornithine racemase family PLP-dependent enzyme [Cryomorphaceae bacterium]
MAYLNIYQEKLRHNFHFLHELFRKNEIEWAVVSKLLCGNTKLLELLVDLGIREICDARISNLEKIKKINAEVNTVYIRPPAKRSIPKVVRFADVSFNTEYETMRLLSEEAQIQDKIHRVIIMIELGDLREGVLGDQLLDFYARVFELPNIEVVGIGSNLNCLYGVMPSEDKLIQLSLYKQLIEAKFNTKIPWVTGGTSVVIPLLLERRLPKGINHFRIGESLFFGNNLFNGKTIKGMKSDVFELFAEIIEIRKKPKVPMGQMEENPSGETYEIKEEDYGKTSYRAILDIGLLDISPDYLKPKDKHLKVVGASSDMIIIDLGKTNRNYKVGDMVRFRIKYMGALALLNSKYVFKYIK